MNDILQMTDSRVHTELRDFFEPTMELLHYSDVVIDELNKKKISLDELDDFKRFCLYSFFKSTSHGKCIWNVASNGYHMESFILLRPVVELYLQLRFVLKKGGIDKESLSTDFFRYLSLKEKKPLEFAIQLSIEKYGQEFLNDIKSKLREMKSLYGDKTTRDYWPSKPMEDLAKELDMRDFYFTVYNQYSKFTHSSIASISSINNPSLGEWHAGSSLAHLDSVFIGFYDLYLRILEILAAGIWRHPFTRFEEFYSEREKMAKLGVTMLDSEHQVSSS